jgi:hypothetical protein
MSEDKSPNSNHNPEITYSKSRKGTEVLISDKDEQDLDKQMEIMVLNTTEENKNINKEAAMETDYKKSYSEIERTEEECKDRTQRIRRDDGSISSKKTVRNTNRHSDSEGSKINLDSPESEDDENTVDSSNSTQFNKKPTNRWIPPKSIRYQIGINLAPIDLNSLHKEFEGPNKDGIPSMDTFDRIRTHLQELFAETKKIDKHSKFITWKDTKIYRVLEGYKGQIPNTNAGVSQFFDGIRLKRDQGRQYIRFRLHSKNEKKMEAELHEWARLSNHSFYRCIIQEEHSTPIGWLLYSSQYTNTQHLSSYLQRETGFEWGFKLGSITKSDEKEDGKPVTWKNRLKAMIVHVPTHKAEVAITKISLLLQAKKAEINQVPLFYQRYLFIQQENTMVDINSRLQYKHILSRQRSHLDSIKSKFILSIDVDMDKRLETQEGGYFSLREMILAINNRQDGKNWDPVPLFHSIDFCPDSSKVWIGNSMGPGGPGHIITYYNVMEAEALQMIRGLGIYLGKIYGYDNIVECFSRDHWQSLEGWKFSKKKWKFTTPETRQMKDNLKLDSNKLMVRMAQRQIRSAKAKDKQTIKPTSDIHKERLKELNGNEGTDSHLENTSMGIEDNSTNIEIQEAFRKNELNLMKKMADTDLDSLHNGAEDEVTKINNIEVHDAFSTASSLTTNTNEILQKKVPRQLNHSPDQTEGSISTLSSLDSITSSIHSITRDKLESLFEEGMTQKQRKERADQYTLQQIRKVMIEKNKLYESLFPDEEKENISIEREIQVSLHDESLSVETDQESKSGNLEIKESQVQLSADSSSRDSFSPVLLKFDKQDLSTLSDDDPPITSVKNSKVRLKDISYEEVSDTSADRGS